MAIPFYQGQLNFALSSSLFQGICKNGEPKLCFLNGSEKAKLGRMDLPKVITVSQFHEK
jgi:hypothetical protein